MGLGRDVWARRLDTRQERSRHVHVTFPTWGTDLDRAVARFEPEGGATGAHPDVAPPNAQLWAMGQGLSPNRRWVLFTVLRFHPTSIEPMVASAEGAPQSAWVRIAPDHDSPDKPRWSADGKTIFFVSKGSTAHLNVWATRFDPERGQPVGEPFALTQFDASTNVISPYLDGSELSISARHAALTMLTVTGSIWMLTHVDR